MHKCSRSHIAFNMRYEKMSIAYKEIFAEKREAEEKNSVVGWMEQVNNKLANFCTQ